MPHRYVQSVMYKRMAIALALAALLAGCSGGGDSPADGGQGSPGAVTDTPTPSGPMSPQPTAPSGSPVATSPGRVTVIASAPSYRVGTPIAVTVGNGLRQPSYTEDTKTDCGIVLLQRRDADTWSDVYGCALGRPAMAVVLGPGLGRTEVIDPHSIHLASVPLDPGTYRLRFLYRLAPGQAGAEPLEALSAAFTIG